MTGKLSLRSESHTQPEIIQAIQEAATWSALKTWRMDNIDLVFRTLPLPDPFHLDPWYTVDWVIKARRRALSQMFAMDLAKEISAKDGQLWVYEPEVSISDGVSSVESAGFLDEHNCPPWDLWVGYVREERKKYVLSWIPPSVVPLAKAGYDTNVEDCIYWLADSGCKLQIEL